MAPKQQPNIHAYICIDRITAQESAIRLEIAEINKRNERLQLKIERLQLEIARQRNIIRDPPKRDPVLERWGFYEEPEPAAEPVAAPSATAARPEPAARPEQRDTASQPPDKMELEASGGNTAAASLIISKAPSTKAHTAPADGRIEKMKWNTGMGIYVICGQTLLRTFDIIGIG